jgi:hypothetical protein
MSDNTSRRELLTNVAMAFPVAAIAAVAGEQPAAAAPKGGTSATVVINSFASGTGGFVGTLTVSGVQLVNGVLSAAGQISGNVLDGTGATTGSVNQAVTAPLQVSASCTILTLVLGPLDLNVLGLVVHLNQVVLNITAVPGAGNLLGNLLCAVANLLNGGLPIAALLNNLVSLVNEILAGL